MSRKEGYPLNEVAVGVKVRNTSECALESVKLSFVAPPSCGLVKPKDGVFTFKKAIAAQKASKVDCVINALRAEVAYSFQVTLQYTKEVRLD
jgi:hypothetical protein